MRDGVCASCSIGSEISRAKAMRGNHEAIERGENEKIAERKKEGSKERKRVAYSNSKKENMLIVN